MTTPCWRYIIGTASPGVRYASTSTSHHITRFSQPARQYSTGQYRLIPTRWTSAIQKSSYSTVVVQDQARSRTRRILTNLTIALGSFLVGGYLTLSYASPFVPYLMGSVKSNEESLAFDAPDQFSREVDDHILQHPLVKSLQARPDMIQWRPHMKIPEEIRHHNFTAGTLQGTDLLTVPPLCFNQKDGKSVHCFFYVGHSLSGHPGIVHGGFLATILDETLALCVFPALPNKVGVTANLTVNYKKPTMTGQFLVLTAYTEKVEGRKAWSHGFIEPLDSITQDESGEWKLGQDPLVLANALFIEPRHAAAMKNLYKQVSPV